MGSIRSALEGSRRLLGVSLVAALAVVASPVVAAETVKIFRSTMSDGSVVLSDKPLAGARSVASNTYVLTAPRGAAEAERDYWRRQAEAFNLRQQQRESSWHSARRISPRHGGDYAMYGDSCEAAGSYGGCFDGYSGGYTGGYSGKPLVPLSRVPRKYSSSPGAVRGRDSGFIGSGFSTAR